MNKCIIIFILILPTIIMAQPSIVPTYFLGTEKPERMCQYFIAGNDPGVIAFTQPTGGALMRIDHDSEDYCIYIFCDAPTNRLLLCGIRETNLGRTPRTVKQYGRQKPDSIYMFQSSPVYIPLYLRDSTEYFDRPIDVAVSSCGNVFRPQYDFVYVLDQGNHRVIKLRYDENLDSLIWVSEFGDNKLKYPTAIDYANYRDSSYANDDIYVTDAGVSRVLRFSASGAYETSYGGWGVGLASISYPTGIAISTSLEFPNRFYVTDSRNHRVMRYYSGSTGPIVAEKEYVFQMGFYPLPMIKSIDTDQEGYLYILDSFHHNISVLTPALDQLLFTYGYQGYETGQFYFPQDIYIDNHEMQVCEDWGDSSGIQSFTIVPGFQKRSVEAPLPGKFALFQNYPNPFNSSTTIRFELPQASDVQITVYNILGQRVARLIDGKMSAGAHSIIWNGTNQNGQTISSGIYFYRLQAGANISSKKLLLLK